MPQSKYQGMTMKRIVAARLAPPNAAGIQRDTVPVSTEESKRNWRIQAYLGQKNFMGNVITRVQLPHDTAASQPARELLKRRQLAMPWQNRWMPPEVTIGRYNNPAQAAAVRQKQLAPPNTYGQFYAFMHALSAAFGTLKGP